MCEIIRSLLAYVTTPSVLLIVIHFGGTQKKDRALKEKVCG